MPWEHALAKSLIVGIITGFGMYFLNNILNFRFFTGEEMSLLTLAFTLGFFVGSLDNPTY